MSCLTTLKLTSASSRARRISRSASSIFSSVSLAWPRRLLKARCSFSCKFSNMALDHFSSGRQRRASGFGPRWEFILRVCDLGLGADGRILASWFHGITFLGSQQSLVGVFVRTSLLFSYPTPPLRSIGIMGLAEIRLKILGFNRFRARILRA